MQRHSNVTILGTRVDMVQIPDALRLIQECIEKKSHGNYIVVTNANEVVAGKKRPEVRDAANNSRLSVPDGFSLILLARFYGYRLKKRAYGPDLMLAALKLAEQRSYSNFFYGSTQNTLDLLGKSLKGKFPALKVSGYYSPPFKDEIEDDTVFVEKINKLSPDILWVGLGDSKQQVWMNKHRDKIKVPVMVGVGAAFNYLSGTKPQAPLWIRNNGFEWLFRLITEPKRLWRRYLINNSLFIYYVMKELTLHFFHTEKRLDK